MTDRQLRLMKIVRIVLEQIAQMEMDTGADQELRNKTVQILAMLLQEVEKEQ